MVSFSCSQWWVPAVPTNRYHAFRYLQCLSLYALVLWRVFTCVHLTRVAEGLTLFVVYSTLLYIIPLTVAAYVGHSRSAMDNSASLYSLVSVAFLICAFIGRPLISTVLTKNTIYDRTYTCVWSYSSPKYAGLHCFCYCSNHIDYSKATCYDEPGNCDHILKTVPHAMRAFHFEEIVSLLILCAIIYGYFIYGCFVAYRRTKGQIHMPINFGSRQTNHSMSMNVGRLDANDVERVSRALETSRSQQQAINDNGVQQLNVNTTSQAIRMSIPHRIPVARAEAMMEGVVVEAYPAESDIEMMNYEAASQYSNLPDQFDEWNQFQSSGGGSAEDWMSLLQDQDVA